MERRFNLILFRTIFIGSLKSSKLIFNFRSLIDWGRDFHFLTTDSAQYESRKLEPMRTFLWIQLANRRLTYKMQQKAYFGHDHEKSSIIWGYYCLWTISGHSGGDNKVTDENASISCDSLSTENDPDMRKLWIIHHLAPDSECHRRGEYSQYTHPSL